MPERRSAAVTGPAPRPFSPAPLRDRRVLVVEDEESFVDALTIGLTREGFRVQVARDGREAVDRFDAIAPDVVLLDVMLPKMSGIDVSISDLDFPDIREVDLKLIELARALQGKIVTNDFNLNKVAQLRGVDVLNVNDLANSLKPVVLPGEIMKVFILKEGKEYNQGVAYLDDGTMVVVDNARKMISKTIDIVVTSVLQTTAGKMIFGRYIETGMAPQANAPTPQVAAGSSRPTGQTQQT